MGILLDFLNRIWGSYKFSKKPTDSFPCYRGLLARPIGIGSTWHRLFLLPISYWIEHRKRIRESGTSHTQKTVRGMIDDRQNYWLFVVGGVGIACGLPVQCWMGCSNLLNRDKIRVMLEYFNWTRHMSFTKRDNWFWLILFLIKII